jgi:hypothetical protein
VDVGAAELSNLIGCISNKPQEVSAEVGMNLGGIDVGKVVGARGDSSQDGHCSGTNASKDMVKVFCGKKVVGLIWRTGEVPLLGVEFNVVGGSNTHAVEGADMEMMRLYQMLYPNINSSGVWQIGCAKQTMTETRADKFFISHEASKDAPHWSVSLAVRPQKMPLIRGLCLVQWTLTTKGLNDLPLVRGLCLMQRTLTTRVSMICPSSEDFVSFNGLWPLRVSMICRSSEDFVSCNGLQLPGVSMICPLLEDFVSCNGL